MTVISPDRLADYVAPILDPLARPGAVETFHLQGQHDQQTHAGTNARGQDIADAGGTIPEKRAPGDVLDEWMSSPEEFAAAQKLAADKARNVPQPTPEQIEKNRAMLAKSKRPGGWGRGNSYTRRARAQALFEEFGGKPGGSCPCGHCGIKVSPGGEGGFAHLTQDKILTAAQGGTYGTVKSGFPNLIPSCGGCNSSRNQETYFITPLWAEDDALAASAGRNTDVTVSEEFVAAAATGKPVGWDTWLEPEVGDTERSGEYITRMVDTWFGPYEQHLVGGEVCDPATIKVDSVELAYLDDWIAQFHQSGGHDQQSHAGGDRRPIPPPPRRREGRPRPGGALPDVSFRDVRIAYRPRHPDGKADPGEVVWAQVPFEEDITRSKDRPVLIIGRTADGEHLVGVQLTSKAGRDRVAVGTGGWDRQGRESYMDTDRFIQVDENNYRREGAYLKKPRFQEIVDVLTERQNAPDVDLALQVFHLDGQHDQQSHGNRGGAKREGRLGPKVLNDDPDRFAPPESWSSMGDVDDAVTAMLDNLNAERTDGVTFEFTGVDYVAALAGWPEKAAVTVDIHAPDGKVIGEVAREFILSNDVSGTHMYAASLKLDAEWQNRGIGTQVQEAFEDFAVASGINDVRVDAANVGRYTWARAAYDFTAHWATMETFGHWTRGLGHIDLADRFQAAAAQLYDAEGLSTDRSVPDGAPTPWEVAEIVGSEAWLNGGPSWKGRKQLRTALAASGHVPRQGRLDAVLAAYAQWWPRFPAAAEGADDPEAEKAWAVLIDVDREDLAATTTTFHAEHDQSTHGNRGGTAVLDSPAAALVAGERVTMSAGEAADTLVEIGNANDGVVDMTNLSIESDPYLFTGVKADGRRPRGEMPQVPERALADFHDHLEEGGVTFSSEIVDPASIKSTQTELDATKVGQMIARVRDGSYTTGHNPWVSNDGYILDGHHRWATMAVLSAAGEAHPEFRVSRVSLPIDELLVLADEFNAQFDITSKTIDMSIQVFHLQGQHDQQSHAGDSAADDDYRGGHRPSETGPRIHDLLESEMTDGLDVYENPHFFTGYSKLELRQTMAQLQRVKGDPEAKVTIYRAAPEGAEITSGDWVTLSRAYAETHMDSGNAGDAPALLQLDVPAKTVRWAVDDLMEYGYFPDLGEQRIFSEGDLAVQVFHLQGQHDQQSHAGGRASRPDGVGYGESWRLGTDESGRPGIERRVYAYTGWDDEYGEPDTNSPVEERWAVDGRGEGDGVLDYSPPPSADVASNLTDDEVAAIRSELAAADLSVLDGIEMSTSGLRGLSVSDRLILNELKAHMTAPLPSDLAEKYRKLLATGNVSAVADAAFDDFAITPESALIYTIGSEWNASALSKLGVSVGLTVDPEAYGYMQSASGAIGNQRQGDPPVDYARAKEISAALPTSLSLATTAVQRHTQDVISEMYPSGQVPVYRGVTRPAVEGAVSINPVSSWSLEAQWAANFGERTVKATVPVSSVFSYGAATGWGAQSEAEVILSTPSQTVTIDEVRTEDRWETFASEGMLNLDEGEEDWIKQAAPRTSANVEVFHLQGQHDQSSHGNRAGAGTPIPESAQYVARNLLGRITSKTNRWGEPYGKNVPDDVVEGWVDRVNGAETLEELQEAATGILEERATYPDLGERPEDAYGTQSILDAAAHELDIAKNGPPVIESNLEGWDGDDDGERYVPTAVDNLVATASRDLPINPAGTRSHDDAERQLGEALRSDPDLRDAHHAYRGGRSHHMNTYLQTGEIIPAEPTRPAEWVMEDPDGNLLPVDFTALRNRPELVHRALTADEIGPFNERIEAEHQARHVETLPGRVEALRAAFDTHGQTPPDYVYRGQAVSSSDWPEFDMEPGDEFVSPGFTSTSQLKHVAHEFARTPIAGDADPTRRVIMSIQTNGRRALPIQEMGSMIDEGIDENEWVMNADTRYRVIGITGHVDDGVTVRAIEVEVI